MGKRLEITLFGSLYVVGAIHLPRMVIKAGINAYGQKDWHSIIENITLGMSDKKTVTEASNVVGMALKPSLLLQGVSMQGRGFGFEVFHGGDFAPVNAVEAENRIVKPAPLLKGSKTGDMLGVFYGQCESAMSFRWDDVEELRQEEIVLEYDSVGLLMGQRKTFDLIQKVTWRGKNGLRKGVGPKPEFHSRKHILHKVN